VGGGIAWAQTFTDCAALSAGTGKVYNELGSGEGEGMPTWRYSRELDPERTAKAALRDVSMSYKATVETLRLIRGRRLEDAKRILEEVVRMERPVPFRRFNRKVAHKKGIPGAGRYPVKVAKKPPTSAREPREQRGVQGT